MKTVEETRRALFEAWADSMGLPHSMLTCGEWAAFNAALDAVVITLPEWQQYDDDFTAGTAFAIDDCRAAIESTNLGLKIK